MIRANSIYKTFNGLEVLKGIDISINKGEIITITGPSGAGKTTLLEILGTLSKPDPKDKTNIQINGTQLTSLNKNQLAEFRNKNLGFVINAQCNAVKNIFKLKKIPFRQIILNKKNEEELGKIFTFFVLETILLSRLMKVNPFDQPAVEQVKNETKKFL